MELKVSIIVVSYNSEKTIIDTLESIKRQTYLNYEVIISDDCSQDETIIKVKKWCEQNKKNNYKILESDKNEGVTKNVNKGLKKSKGDWIKFIAADDILLPTCLEENVKFINENKNVRICFSKAETFGKVKKVIPNGIKKKVYNLSAEQQYEKLKWENLILAPTSFISRKIFEYYGFFDERIPMIEDAPYWLLLTSKGEKLYFLDKVTVKYRIGESLSLHQNKIESIVAYESRKLYYEYYLKKEKSLLLKWHYKLEFIIKDILIKKFDNKRKLLVNLILRYYRILDIGYILEKIKLIKK